MKKSFILHIDSLCVLEEMSNEQKGILFDAIYKFHLGENVELDFSMRMAFAPFKNQFKRDDLSYQRVIERNKKNGKKGGRPSDNQHNKPKKPSGLIGNPENLLGPKKAESKNDSDSDSDNDNDNDSKNKKVKKGRAFIPPSLDDVIIYFKENGYSKISACKAFSYYNESNWIDSKGNKVINWKQKMIAVWFKEENRENENSQSNKYGYEPINGKPFVSVAAKINGEQ